MQADADCHNESSSFTGIPAARGESHGAPVTLFTGQWADLPLEELARKAGDFGYDGLELACWGDHFDVARPDRAGLLQPEARTAGAARPQVLAISAHLVGQAVLDRIDDRHQAILPPAFGATAIRRA